MGGAMKIVIPSHNREESARYLKFVPKSDLHNVYLVVRSGEQEAKYAHHKDNGVNVIGIDNLTGIHTKRDAIARHFKGEKIWMIDDDVELFNMTTRDVGTLKVADLTEKDYFECMEWCTSKLDEMPYGNIRSLMFPVYGDVVPFVKNKWVGGNALLNLSVIDADLLDYAWSDYAEDVVGFLNVLMAGHDSFCVAKWLTTTDKPGKKGGMTGQRPLEKIEPAMERIHKRFPDITTIFQSKYVFPGHDRGAKTLKLKLRNLREARIKKMGFFE